MMDMMDNTAIDWEEINVLDDGNIEIRMTLSKQHFRMIGELVKGIVEDVDQRKK